MSKSSAAPDYGAKTILKNYKKDDFNEKLRQHFVDVSKKTWDAIGDWEQEPEQTMLHKWSLSYLCVDPEFVKNIHSFNLAHPWKGFSAVPGMKTILENAPPKLIKDGLEMRLIEIKHVAHLYDEEGKKHSSVDKLVLTF
ncbi:MAG: hypothetical protein QFB87_02785 [Patescibacteria group bacterium]|nr:hypothetical protein [Patescibacteria group bacterium]